MAGLDDLLKALGVKGDDAQQPTQPTYSFLGSHGKTYDHTPTEKDKFLAAQDTAWADKHGGTTPFYPQKRYITENLAPERGLTNNQLEALAQANQQALSSGLMSKNLADKMLPTLLTEGASGTRGWGYPDTPRYQEILEKAGLPPKYDDAVAQFRNLDEYGRELWNAKMMHAMMAAKADLYGEDKAVERWNGKGRWNKASPDTKGADAASHARKVAATEEMLAHPKNKELVDTWSFYQKRHAAGQDVPTFKELPETYDKWEDNVPAIIGNPVKALRNAVPDVSLKDVQRAVRNWTAPQEPTAKKKGGMVDKPLKGGNKLI